MKNLLALLSFAFIFSTPALAGDHSMGRVTGTNIEMANAGHGISGRIGDKLIFGHLDEGAAPKTSTLRILKNDQVIDTTFTNTDGVWGGDLAAGDRALKIKLVRIDSSAPAYIIEVNGKEYTVKVEYDAYESNHFINPRFVAMIDGKEVSAKFHNGQSCWMYSMHLIFMIYGSYLL